MNISEIKQMIVKVPVLGPALRSIRAQFTGRKPLVFESSGQYWEDRYHIGGTSGAGSYGRLAEFKARVINHFVKTNDVASVVEFGCGDGAQLSLAIYPRYTGFDVAEASIEICKNKFEGSRNLDFFMVGSQEFNSIKKQDLALSLDVIYHLIEDEVFERYMLKLFDSASRFVIIYSYSFEKSYASKHERGRDFMSWIDENITGWELFEKIENEYPYNHIDPENTSQSDFYIFKAA